MLKVDQSLDHIPARREHVVALHESINQPVVNIPAYGTAPTGAYVLGTRNDQGHYTVFVYLFQAETKGVVVYVSEPRALAAEQYRPEEAEAVRFVESMGFLVDALRFPALSPPEQDAVMNRVPIFRPPAMTFDLTEVADQVSGVPSGAPNPMFGGMGAADRQAFGSVIPGAKDEGSNIPAGFVAAPSRPSAPPPASSSRASAPPPPPPSNSMPPPPAPAVDPMAVLKGAVPGMIPNANSESHSIDLQLESAPASGLPVPPRAEPSHHPTFSKAPPPSVPQPSAPPSAPPMPPKEVSTPPFGSFGGDLNVPPPAPSGPPRGLPPPPPPPATDMDDQALMRLGRLLALFVLLLSFGSAMTACRSGPPPLEGRALEAQVDVGNQQLASRQWRDAVVTFQSVVDSDPEHRDALRGLGMCYLNLGRIDEAEAFYERSVASDPSWSVPKNELAVVRISKGKCAEAAVLLKEVLKDILYQTPEFAEHNLAQAEQCMGDLAGATTRLENLVVKRPYFCLGYLTLAQFSAQAGKHETTIRACDDFAHNCEENKKIQSQVMPEHSALCYLKKGLAYAELGDVESARASFERCPADGPNARECKKSLSLLPR